jgi:hypothetical protein
VARRRHARRHLHAGLLKSRDERAHGGPVGRRAVDQVLEPQPDADLALPLELAHLARSQRRSLGLVRRPHLREAVLPLDLPQDLLATAVVVRVGDGAAVGSDPRGDDVDVIVLGVAVADHDERRPPVAKVLEVALGDLAPVSVAQLLPSAGPVRQREGRVEDGAA